jgi:hypothetical protein
MDVIDRKLDPGAGASLAEEFRSRLVARIRELETSIAELEDLRGIAASLGIDLDLATRTSQSPTQAARPGAPMSPRHARASRSRGARGSSRTTPSRAAGARGPTRRDRVLEIVGDQPDITVSELVKVMSVNRTSLYPVVRQLISDGLIDKNGQYLRFAGR